MVRTRRRWLALTAIAAAFGAVAAAYAGCTVFDILTPEQTYLDTNDDAAFVCGAIFACRDSQLARGLAMSAGIPVSDSNFSLCMTWLTAPLPPNRIGIDSQR